MSIDVMLLYMQNKLLYLFCLFLFILMDLTLETYVL